ncbi:MAG: FtsW/RodA/SpoVE family cell cycle protein, partial [Paracoccaceae bacterium]|nr:FtsW/RodA/SpoVE family cell cycle protein [Paracoccaceae bacterium]
MSYLEYTVKTVPTGLRKVLYLNWALVILLITVSCYGFLMLYSVAGGSFQPWAGPQMIRFGLGLVIMFSFAFVPIWFWRNISGVAYIASLLLLIVVDVAGSSSMGAQRWIN